METAVPHRALVAVAIILVILSALGIYQGIRRAGSGDQEGDSGPAGLIAPTSGAKTASALTEPTAAVLTEAQVRDIVRQEMHSGASKPAAPSTSNDDDDSPAASVVKPPATLTPPPKVTPGPALQTPIAPTAPTPAEGGGSAPLY